MEKILEEVLLSDNFDVHQDWEVPIPGFFIVAAKDTSRPSIADFTTEQANELVSVIQRVRGAMRTVLGIEDVYIFQNEDTEHGFHVWMFPRHTWMEQFGRKIESVRPAMLYAREHMMTEENLLTVKEFAQKAREALQAHA
jgi:diadenosine tetraphosphate (Ap4A) HIT family hydrolase